MTSFRKGTLRKTDLSKNTHSKEMERQDNTSCHLFFSVRHITWSLRVSGSHFAHKVLVLAVIKQVE